MTKKIIWTPILPNLYRIDHKMHIFAGYSIHISIAFFSYYLIFRDMFLANLFAFSLTTVVALVKEAIDYYSLKHYCEVSDFIATIFGSAFSATFCFVISVFMRN